MHNAFTPLQPSLYVDVLCTLLKSLPLPHVSDVRLSWVAPFGEMVQGARIRNVSGNEVRLTSGSLSLLISLEEKTLSTSCQQGCLW